MRLDFKITMKLGTMEMEKGLNKIFNAKNLDCGIQVPKTHIKEMNLVNLVQNDCIIVECTIRENRALRNQSSEYFGLINSGNLCYMNSVIQTLFHLGGFQRLIFQVNSYEDC